MDSKYYVPEIEDIRIGYEYEEFYSRDDNWYKGKVEDFEEADLIIKEKLPYDSIRTAYLTKEQIEAEGWIFLKKVEEGYTKMRFSDNNYLYFSKGDLSLRSGNWDKFQMRYQLDSQMAHITGKARITGVHYRMLTFYGLCPSVNELRYISKLLGINAA